MTEHREQSEAQPPSGRQARRTRSQRRRHPAAGTRKVLAAGSVAATLGLTGVLWGAAQASSQSTDAGDDSTSTSDDSYSSYSYDDDSSSSSYDDDSSYDSDDDGSSSYDSDDSVDVSPSYDVPDTSSGAS